MPDVHGNGRCHNFPAQKAITYDKADDHQPTAHVSAEKVPASLDRIKDNKAPELDGVPNIDLKTVVKARTSVFTILFHNCHLEDIFPDDWKKPRLVIFLKPGKQP